MAITKAALVVSAKDRVTGSYSYSPYGVSQYEGEPLVNAFQYAGREYDAEDLYYYRARYYDPSIGRFLSEDPIGYASGDSNFYRYVFNDPINHTDPSGNVGIAGFGIGVVVDLGIQLALNGGNIRCVSLGQLAVAGALGAVGAIGVARVAALVKAGNAVKGGSVGAARRLQFEASPKHGLFSRNTSKGVASRGPTDGQHALDTSIQIKNTSPRRIGVDRVNGEIVVFPQTTPGVFHGFVTPFKSLTTQQQNALRKSGLVDKKGNIN